MKPRGWIAAVIVLGLAIGAWFHMQGRGTGSQQSLTVYCAASQKKPVEAIAAAYQRENGVTICLQYGGSASLLSAIQITQKGDLFISADDGTIADARRLGFARDVIPLVKQQPVLAVAKGNPKNIRALDDLLKKGVRFALANPESASISRVARKTLGDRWQPLQSRAVVLKPTVMDIATDLLIGAVDAGIVWDTVVAQFPALEMVHPAEFANVTENASVALLSFSKQPGEATKFARYLAAPDKGGQVFVKNGYTLATSGAAPSAHPSNSNP